MESQEELSKHYDLLANEYNETYHSGFRAKIRNRIIFSTLEKIITKKSSKILDAGGGTGFYSIPFATQGHEVTILDISKGMLEKALENAEKSGASERVKTIQGSMDHLNFPDSHFDIVLCHLAFEHVSEPSKTLSEFHRVLKNGGILSLTVPNKHFYCISEGLRGNFSRAKMLLQTENFFVSPRKGLPKVRVFTKSGIVNLCKAANFEILHLKGIRIIFDYLSRAPRKLEELERLEMKLSEVEDLSFLGKHVYVVCRKPLALSW